MLDSNWGERLLDLRTPDHRRRLARLVERWMVGCAQDGFVAVEIDNLDSWTRSRRLLTRRQSAAYARLLTQAAHRSGLAVAQKNTAELLDKKLGFDFAVVEDCARWRECRFFADSFDERVFIVEYSARGWKKACRQVGGEVSVLLRDRKVSATGPFRIC